MRNKAILVSFYQKYITENYLCVVDEYINDYKVKIQVYYVYFMKYIFCF